MGFSFDWNREINTIAPAYYKWTQWIFLKLFERGLAYKASVPVNWCPRCQCGLANEEAQDGVCERCGTAVESREKNQWLLRITAYADRLADDLAKVDYPVRVKAQQRHWIGRSVDERGAVTYRMRDWVFSRQRFWGEPIPLVNCPDCGWVAVPEAQLPVVLPAVPSYEPGADGESPLAAIRDWVETSCPCCGRPARRETDTMPQWAGSCWYYLRYLDPHNDSEFATAEKIRQWPQVDLYNGGMEHTTLHLLYARFWHKVLYDCGLAPDDEPFARRTSQGMVLGENREKMSKSRGNMVSPDDLIDRYGADTVRLYELYMGAYDQVIPWSTDGIAGCRRFVERVWRLTELLTDGEEYSPEMQKQLHRAIRKVSEDYAAQKYNTAIAALMTLVNGFYKVGKINRAELRTLLQLTNPADGISK